MTHDPLHPIREQQAHLESSFYATKPTKKTRWLRTFFPFQVLRFLSLNVRMVKMIKMSHKGQDHK